MTSTPEIVLSHIERAHKLSETRTPLITCLRNGDPLRSVEILAKKLGVTVWKIAMDTPKNEQNALDYLEVGLQNGDWLYLVQCEKATTTVMREIAMQLTTTQPDPKNFPRRELFRLWLIIEDPIDVNDTVNPIFPAIMTQNCLFAWKQMVKDGQKPKIIAKRRVDPEQAESEIMKRDARRDRGQDSDDESDEEEDPQKKLTGMWFYRSVDFFQADADNAVTKSVEDIFTAIERGDLEKVKEIILTNTVDLNQITHSGLTPLFWAIISDNLAMVRLLLENEADPNLPRVASGMPPIFMSLESPDMLQLLLDYGADIDARFEGKSLMDHPDTAPAIKDYIRKNHC